MPPGEEIIWEAIKEGLTASMKEDFEEKDSNYFTITPKEWINLIETLEARDDRMHTACEN